MTPRTLLTRLGAAIAAVFVLVPAATAAAALPQQGASLDLAALAPNQLFYAPGSGEQAGTSVASAGDVNGDGVGDIVVGSPLADANGRADSGTAYIIYGRDGLAARTNLGAMGVWGVRIDGTLAGDRFGSFVAPAGDVDGDGRDDVLVGAPLADPSSRLNAGAVYAITGASTRSYIDTASLGSLGYRIDGAVTGDRAGSWVSGDRDFDGDGRPDIALTAAQADPSARTDAGSAWVVHGGSAVDLLSPGASALRIDGGTTLDTVTSAALVPDTNGDGLADVLVGVPGADPSGRSAAGAAWVVTGRADATTVDLGAPGAGPRIDGALSGDALGQAVGSSPDLTGDGSPELLVGAPYADPYGRSGAGSLYVLGGRSLPAATDLAVDSPAVLVNGAQAGDGVGTTADGGGDLNGDGRPDLALGAPRADFANRVDPGVAYVLYGRSLSGTIDLATPPVASTRAGGSTHIEYTGTSVAWVGDATGDGRDDLFVGAPRGDLVRTDVGIGWMVMGFGAPSFSYPTTVEATARVAASAARPSAVRRTGTATYSISPALPEGMSIDKATGAISGTPTSLVDPPTTHTLTLTDLAGTASRTVTLHVSPAAGACTNVRPALTANADVFTGSIGGDSIHAGAGGDTVDARAGDDCVYGEAGDDALNGAEGSDQLFGGTDNDTLIAGPGDDVIDGDGGNDTVDGGEGNDAVTADYDNDTVHGGPGDDVLSGAEGSDGLAGDAGDDRISGGTDADTITGGAGRDTVAGDGGEDRIDGGGDADEVHGGDGVDELYGGAGDDAVWSDQENDFVDGGAGNDRVWAGDGRDSAHGGDGNDMLAGENDDDDLFGDDGADELHGGASQDELRGGDGGDAIFGEDGQDLVDGEQGNDLLSGGPGFDHLTGDVGADGLSGDAGGDILEGGPGNDTLSGGAGDDRLFGGAGDDVVSGGDGKDQIEEIAGSDRVSGGGGSDEITVKRGGASVDAGAGNDEVVAFNGKRDTIACGAGRDTAYVDAIDKVKGCETRVHSKPPAASASKKKRKKSSRAKR